MKSVYKHGEAAYIVLKKKPIFHFASKLGDEPDMEYVKLYMEWIKSDHVLRSETHFIFCETILDAEIIVDEHITNNSN